MSGPFRDLSLEEIYRISAKNRASRTHRLGDVVQDSREPETRQEAPQRSGTVPPATAAPAMQPAPLESKNPGIPGVYLTLPWPPTVNHYWLPARNGRLYISAKGLSFRAQVKMLAHGLPLTAGAVGINISAHPPDKRRRDLDNILKACLDALQHAGLIEDDSNVDVLLIRRGPIVKGGQVDVEIQGR